MLTVTLSIAAQTNNAAGSARSSETRIPAGQIKFINAELSQVLVIYTELAHAEVDTKQLGNAISPPMSFENKDAITRSEAVKLLDKLFYDNGILATHVDDKHIVLKYRASAKAK